MRARAWLAAAALAWTGSPPHASAQEIYECRGAGGVARFSDRCGPGEVRRKLRAASAPRAAGALAEASGRRTRRRTLAIAELDAGIERIRVSPLIEECAVWESSDPLRALAEEWQAGRMRDAVQAALAELDYPIASEAPRSGPAVEPAELSLKGVVEEIRFQECPATLQLRVRWRVYDALLDRVVHESRVLGRGAAGNPQGWSQVGQELEASARSAVRDAARQLGRSADFARWTDPDFAQAQGRFGLGEPLWLQLEPEPAVASFDAAAAAARAATASVRVQGRSGSGLLLDGEGHLLTSAALLREERRALVVLDGRPHWAELLRLDLAQGTALLQLAERPAPPGAWLAARPAAEAMPVFLSTAGLSDAEPAFLTEGIVSALRVHRGRPLFQTDAAALAESVGAPVLDARGAVIGMLLGGLRSRAAEDLKLSFALPIGAALCALQVDSRLGPCSAADAGVPGAER